MNIPTDGGTLFCATGMPLRHAAILPTSEARSHQRTGAKGEALYKIEVQRATMHFWRFVVKRAQHSAR